MHTILIGANAWSKGTVESILATPGVFRFLSSEPLSPAELQALSPPGLGNEGSPYPPRAGLIESGWLVPHWGHWARRNFISSVAIGVLLAISVLARLRCAS